MDMSNDLFELLAVLFVSHGSAGSHLLFKYPFSNQNQINFYKNSTGKYIFSLYFCVFDLFNLYASNFKVNKKSSYSILPNDNCFTIEK